MELKNLYEKFFLQKKQPKLYAYTYKMTFPYKRFRIIMDKVENLCKEDRALDVRLNRIVAIKELVINPIIPEKDKEELIDGLSDKQKENFGKKLEM